MKIAGVILAAGLGKRMNSPLPKVLHKIDGIPMLQYVLNTLYQLKPQKIVVVGRNVNEIKKSISDKNLISFALQKEPKGTGDALLRALPLLRGYKGTVIVLNGDTPLITQKTLKKLLNLHKKGKNDISMISFMAEEPNSYGRVIRNEKGNITSIIEEGNATDLQRNIKEVNSGIYAIEPEALPVVKEIKLNPSKGEYYLTDIIGIARKKGIKVGAYCIGTKDELIGVNTQQELQKAQKLIKYRIVKNWMARGVSFVDDKLVYISPEVRIDRNTLIYPNVHLEGKTKIGKGCTIYPNVRIHSSIIGDRAIIKDATLIENAIVRNGASVGPFTRIRPGSEIGRDARIGSFVEVKKSVIGSCTKASHLTYIGDAKVGNNVNIGAGTITCNYDGYKKYITIIEDDAFIGSDSQLVAPVKIGKGAYIGAGSTITEDVPSKALALSRTRQKNIKGWVAKRHPTVKSKKKKKG